MGSVYEAEHRDTGRRVALKVIRRLIPTEAESDRFRRESQLGARVNHPNLVYVFGREDIDQHSVIVMELAAGGTLRQRLASEGPLKPSEAIDAILQILEGLHALHSVGLIHRDLKPANCFVTAQGLIKIGDFGLSTPVQTIPVRVDRSAETPSDDPTLDSETSPMRATNATAPGTPMGTPAYASPEQWYGGTPLDFRSDIYSVGAIFYELLTGTVPPRPPPAAAAWPREIPPSLVPIIARCLATERTRRYADCAELRRALVPFGRRVALPANPGWRLAAGTADFVIVLAAVTLMTGQPLNAVEHLLAAIRGETGGSAAVGAVTLLLGLLTWVEGYTGGTPGKCIFGLRVRFPAEHGAKRWMACLCRGLTFHLPWLVLPFVALPAVFAALGISERGHAALHVTAIGGIAILAILFSTVGRSTDYPAIHDLLSRTRVVRLRSRVAIETRLAASARISVHRYDPETHLGPYRLVNPLWRTDTESLWTAVDETLERTVWILRGPPTKPAVSVQRHTLDRPGRLRWLSGRRTATEAWDAFEAFDGEPLATVPRTPRPWGSVRRWLLDLAREYRAGWMRRDLPDEVQADRIWIVDGGRPVLLDFPGPSGPTSRPAATQPSGPGLDAMHAFLEQSLDVALGPNPEPLGMESQSFVRDLRAKAFAGPEAIIQRLEGLLDQPAALSRSRRALAIAAWPCMTLVLAWLAYSSAGIVEVMRRSRLAERAPEAADLLALLLAREELFAGIPRGIPVSPDNPIKAGLHSLREPVDVRIADLARNHLAQLTRPGVLPVSHARILLPFAEQALIAHPAPTPERIREARTRTQHIVDCFSYRTGPFHSLGAGFTDRVVFKSFNMLALASFVLVPLEALWILARRESLLLRPFGLTVARRDGTPASRLQLLARHATTVTLLALLLIVSIDHFACPLEPPTDPESPAIPTTLLGALIAVLMIVGSLRDPRRAPTEVLTRTYLVLR